MKVFVFGALLLRTLSAQGTDDASATDLSTTTDDTAEPAPLLVPNPNAPAESEIVTPSSDDAEVDPSALPSALPVGSHDIIVEPSTSPDEGSTEPVEPDLAGAPAPGEEGVAMADTEGEDTGDNVASAPEGPAEVPAEEPVEVPAEEPAEVPAEEPVEVPAEEPVEEASAEPAEEPVEEASAEPAEETSEEPAVTPDELVEETPEGTTDEPSAADAAVDAPPSDSSEEIVELPQNGSDVAAEPEIVETPPMLNLTNPVVVASTPEVTLGPVAGAAVTDPVNVASRLEISAVGAVVTDPVNVPLAPESTLAAGVAIAAAPDFGLIGNGIDNGNYDGQDYGYDSDDGYDSDQECPEWCLEDHDIYKDKDSYHSAYDGEDHDEYDPGYDADDKGEDDDYPMMRKKQSARLRRRQDPPSSGGGFAAFQWPSGGDREDECDEDIPDWLYLTSHEKPNSCKRKCPASCYKSKHTNEPYPTRTLDDYEPTMHPYPAPHDPYTKPYEPYTTPYEEPYTTPYEEPYHTPYQEPYTTPYQEPYTTPYEEPYTTPYQEPYATPYQEPYTTPYQEPYTTPYETPYTTPYEEPYTTPYEEPDYSSTTTGYDDFNTLTIPDISISTPYTTPYVEPYYNSTTTGYDDFNTLTIPDISMSTFMSYETTIWTPTTFVTSTTTGLANPYPAEHPDASPVGEPYPPVAAENVGWTGDTLANVCPKTCDPVNPTKNKCEITTSCTTTGKGKYYCACRAGYRASAWNAKDFSKQFRFQGQPYVYTAEGVVCDTVCSDQTCSEVMERPKCQ